MTISTTTQRQQIESGLLAGFLAATVTLLGDEKVTPFQTIVAFTGGFLVGSRKITVQTVPPDAPLA